MSGQNCWHFESIPRAVFEKVLAIFSVNDAKPRTTPLTNHIKLSKEQSPKIAQEREDMTLVSYASVVGSLMYAMVCTRPGIAYVVKVVSRYMAHPSKEHWEAIKWLLRYLRSTSSTSLCFGNGKAILQSFVDDDLGGDVDSSKSTSGYIYTIGGTAVIWISRLQKCVSLSSTESEYMAIAEAGKEMIWLADYLEELVEDGDMCLEKIEVAKNPADMLTKCVDVGKLRL
ncbi:hypothetical protein T459_07369 [Capsicum annuum]|uniref:Retrovirus-related Pol polyprotein from transposon TNT 1-94 n=1 Tax=Capsicum annuum TaxID=4072 RepID=A0A2G2ZTH7_CAPAN|nr:hypothetical protein T459_07369 [Capsicum annuum]